MALWSDCIRAKLQNKMPNRTHVRRMIHLCGLRRFSGARGEHAAAGEHAAPRHVHRVTPRSARLACSMQRAARECLNPCCTWLRAWFVATSAESSCGARAHVQGQGMAASSRSTRALPDWIDSGACRIDMVHRWASRLHRDSPPFRRQRRRAASERWTSELGESRGGSGG